jgi:putative ABC transport system permease protein
MPKDQKAFVYTQEEFKKWVERLVDRFFTLTYLQMLIAVVVAALGLMNTMLISVGERKREIGVLRAIGTLRRQVIKMILLEAVSITLIGLATGVLAGILNAYFLIRIAVKVVAGFNLPFRFPVIMILIALPLVILVGLISAWLPARRAANLKVVDALNYE